MPPEISVHDNSVVAYEVLAKEKKIVLHTECDSHELTDIVFEEVLAYDFENALSKRPPLKIQQIHERKTVPNCAPTR